MIYYIILIVTTYVVLYEIEKSLEEDPDLKKEPKENVLLFAVIRNFWIDIKNLFKKS